MQGPASLIETTLAVVRPHAHAYRESFRSETLQLHLLGALNLFATEIRAGNPSPAALSADNLTKLKLEVCDLLNATFSSAAAGAARAPIKPADLPDSLFADAAYFYGRLGSYKAAIAPGYFAARFLADNLGVANYEEFNLIFRQLDALVTTEAFTTDLRMGARVSGSASGDRLSALLTDARKRALRDNRHFFGSLEALDFLEANTERRLTQEYQHFVGTQVFERVIAAAREQVAVYNRLVNDYRGAERSLEEARARNYDLNSELRLAQEQIARGSYFETITTYTPTEAEVSAEAGAMIADARADGYRGPSRAGAMETAREKLTKTRKQLVTVDVLALERHLVVVQQKIADNLGPAQAAFDHAKAAYQEFVAAHPHVKNLAKLLREPGRATTEEIIASAEQILPAAQLAELNAALNAALTAVSDRIISRAHAIRIPTPDEALKAQVHADAEAVAKKSGTGPSAPPVAAARAPVPAMAHIHGGAVAYASGGASPTGFIPEASAPPSTPATAESLTAVAAAAASTHAAGPAVAAPDSDPTFTAEELAAALGVRGPAFMLMGQAPNLLGPTHSVAAPSAAGGAALPSAALAFGAGVAAVPAPASAPGYDLSNMPVPPSGPVTVATGPAAATESEDPAPVAV